jgi:hypothetical protein
MAFPNFSIQTLFDNMKSDEERFRKKTKKGWNQFRRNRTFAEAVVSVLAHKKMLSVDLEEALALLSIPSDVEQAKSSKREKISTPNIGEREEQKLKIHIYKLIRDGKNKELVNIFGSKAQGGIQLFAVNEPNKFIKELDEIGGKAGSCYKADMIIEITSSGRRWHPSIKSMKGGNPSIINHTPRSAKIFQEGGSLHYLLPKIDNVIRKYHRYRKAPCGTEEVELNGPFLATLDQEDKNTLIKVIQTFMFDETGKGCSKCSADSLLVINKDNTYTFIKLDTDEKQREYIQKNLSKFNIALVSRKGLPKKIKTKKEAEIKCKTDGKYKIKYNQMKPWIYETDKRSRSNPEGKVVLKAALHVRMFS